MNKHTAGPWHMVRKSYKDSPKIKDGQDLPVAIITTDHIKSVQWHANAALIAASPKMYEALYTVMRDKDALVLMHKETYAAVVDAIFLAEGRPTLPAPAVPADETVRGQSSSTPAQDLDSGNGEGFEQQQGTHPTS